MAKRPPKQTHYERSEAYAKQVSGEIIEQIKKGVAPWQKPWKPGEQTGATNIASGKAHTGGDSLYLMSRQISEGRGDNRWGTYRQIEAAGGQVRRGEKGTQVLFYQNRTERPAKDEAGKVRKDKEGKTIYEEAENVRPVMRQYTVFNVEQADGLKLPPRKAEATPEWDTHREADKVLRASGAMVQHIPGGDRASYSPTEDKIVLPDPSQFATRNGYYQTALHEAGHSTGHHDRMNRDTLKEGMAAGFGSPEYAREELRAEISAMMTGEQVGVGHDPRRDAAYVENWVKVLEKDPHEIRRAAGDAQKMTNYLCPDAAMPVHPDCRHPIHILVAGRAWQFGGVEGAFADAPHPDLPILERRRIRQDRIGIVRAGCQDQRIVHDQRDLEAGGRVPALRPRRWIGRREHRRDQIIPRVARGHFSPARLHATLELSSDLPAL